MHTTGYQVAVRTRDTTGSRIAACPERGCGLPTEIYDEVDLASTDGPVAHVRTVCVAGHWLFMPLDRPRSSQDTIDVSGGARTQ